MTIQEAYEEAAGHLRAGRLQQAEFLVQQIRARQPNHADALHLMGLIWHHYGRSPQAVGFIRRAIGLNPNSADYHNSLATLLIAQGAADAAITAARQAVALRQEFAEAHHNLATALADKGELDEAIDCFRRALSVKPEYSDAEFRLGDLLREIGQLDEALACYSRAATTTSDPRMASSFLYTLHFHPGTDTERIAEEHARWNRTFARPPAQRIRPHDNPGAAGADRPLKVGYVSPNFRLHPVGRFFAPLPANHDRERFEVYCYSDVQRPDELTRRIDSFDPIWRNVVGLSNEDLAERVRADAIDILVDLTLHMEGSRLLAFALKPAPVQVTYLAYPSTSGLETMDYRLTDGYLDPPDRPSPYLERPVQLNSFWCYEPPEQAPLVEPAPARKTDHVTFGCLSDFGNLAPPVWSAWRELLAKSPTSRLIVDAPEGSHRALVRSQFAADGIDPQRVQFVQRLAFDRYLEQYNQIDIVLDSFPFCGEITTCDALWMGVPVVSLAGPTAVSRAGLSILSQIGLRDLVALDVEAYVEVALGLANNLDRLADLRSTLRSRMQSSPLMDAPAHAREVEAAFRRMWHDWCGAA